MAADRPRFTILGGGLAGPLMAAYLGQAGYPVRLFEMRSDPREAGITGGRSINLALSRRGLHALSEVGLRDEIARLSIPMRGRMMHAVSGALTYQPYGTEPDQFLNSVSRGQLNVMLLEAAERSPNVELVFGEKCADVEIETGTVVLENTETGETRRVESDIVIGADGAFSKVRAAMQRQDRFDYSQDYLEHGYKELSMPALPDGGFALEKHALHIWPRRTYMMIALPNLDGTFTCTLFWPFEGAASFASIQGDAEIRGFFERTFPDVPPRIPDLVGEYERNPVGSLVTVRCRPWNAGGRCVLIGDAAHAVVPFYGQGINAGFEDGTVLMGCIRAHAPDWEAAFSDYTARRKEHVDALADLAIHNFVEMRDHVGSTAFLLRKSTERALHRLFPKWYLPLYTMVTFTRIPYGDAVRKAASQDRTVAGAAILILVAILILAGWLLQGALR